LNTFECLQTQELCGEILRGQRAWQISSQLGRSEWASLLQERLVDNTLSPVALRCFPPSLSLLPLAKNLVQTLKLLLSPQPARRLTLSLQLQSHLQFGLQLWLRLLRRLFLGFGELPNIRFRQPQA
jgi:hypothetical protein